MLRNLSTAMIRRDDLENLSRILIFLVKRESLGSGGNEDAVDATESFTSHSGNVQKF